MKERTPAQIIGNDRVAQLIFEGYAIVPRRITEAMDDAMTKIGDGPFRSHQEFWSELLEVAGNERAERIE